MGDATRRALMELLRRGGPMSVAELSGKVSVSRPAVSQHLKVLKEAVLVKSEALGTRRVYEVDQKGLTAMRTYLDQLWSDALESFAKHIEEG